MCNVRALAWGMCMWLLLCVCVCASKASAQASEDATAIWGPYAGLHGSQWQAGSTSYRFEWIEPNRVLGQFAEGRDKPTYRIERGPQIGELLYIDRTEGIPITFTGRVLADGRLQLERKALGMRGGFRISRTVDGRLAKEWLKFKGDEVAVREGYTSYMASSAAPAVAVAPASTSQSELPATTTAIVAEAPAPASAAQTTSETPLQQARRKFGPIVDFNGQRLVGKSDMLEVQLLDANRLALQFYGPDGRQWRRYLVGTNTERPNELSLLETARGEKNSRPAASVDESGALLVDSQDGWFHGWRYHQLFKPTKDGIASVYNSEFKNQLRITLSHMGGHDNVRDLYRPMTAERVAEALSTQRSQQELARIEAENRRRDAQEKQAMWNAALAGFSSGVSQGMADAQRAQDEQRAFLGDLERDARRIDQQRENDLRRAEQVMAASQPAQVTVPSASAATSQSAPTEQAAKEQQAQDEQMHMAAAERIEAERFAKVEREQREAAQRKQAAEKAAEQTRKQSEQSLRSGFSGRATTCIGGGKNVLYLQTNMPSKKGCNVSFEARCPSTPGGAGLHFSQNNYIGGSCQGVGDNIRIGTMGCSAEQVLISMIAASCR